MFKVGNKYKTTFSGGQRVTLLKILDNGLIDILWRKRIYVATIDQLIKS